MLAILHATAYGSSVDVYATSAGSAGNYAVYINCYTQDPQFNGYSYCASGGSMSGGSSPDSGTVYATINGHTSGTQSWNLYSYVRNNPLISIDQDGNYDCGQMTADQCTQFGNNLTAAQNQLAAAGSGSTLDCSYSTFSMTREYVYSGKGIATEFTVSGSTETVKYSNVNAGGKMIATYQGTTATQFNFTDWLGTKRVETNYQGVVTSTSNSLPFGDYLAVSGTDTNENHFTGKERDAESNLDYFGARYYNSSFGRFMSPDWSSGAEAVPYAKLDDPQSLNLYGYVRNNPMSAIDVEGHSPFSLINADQIMGENIAMYQQQRNSDQQKQAQQNRQPDGSYKATSGQLAAIHEADAKGTHIYSASDPANGPNSGQCVTACKYFTGVIGLTTSWRGGRAATDLTDADIGTAIATFPGGEGSKYGGNAQNSGVFLGKSVGLIGGKRYDGILFADQWPKLDGNKPVTIWFMPTNSPNNPNNSAMNASSYRVIRVP